ncbi:MAG: FHA domain-containing protein [Planctomycetes bacterium]|nr:FHA domain-containing protein [Planctomycetota bacterium]MCH9775935.1 FHA domain-containing protein [Planctomycetota bacterium]MCH9792974.1 FHA domain-containing protein [Planctomycetota bacterium]MDF1744539.1 FHA domain-containing protein [Gimesia sp.]
MAVCLVPVNQGRPIVLDKAIILVGRHPDCDIVISDSPKISRKHCCLAIVNDRPIIRDLGSMNGVYVNGKKVEKQAWLKLNDELKIGNVAYHLENIGAESQKKNDDAEISSSGEDSPTKAPSVQHFKKPNKDVDISQQFPIAISDSGQSVKINEMLPIDDLESVEEDEDDDDENYSDSHRFEGSGSHVEFISS